MADLPNRPPPTSGFLMIPFSSKALVSSGKPVYLVYSSAKFISAPGAGAFLAQHPAAGACPAAPASLPATGGKLLALGSALAAGLFPAKGSATRPAGTG